MDAATDKERYVERGRGGTTDSNSDEEDDLNSLCGDWQAHEEADGLEMFPGKSSLGLRNVELYLRPHKDPSS